MNYSSLVCFQAIILNSSQENTTKNEMNNEPYANCEITKFCK